jgi:superfamily II DNA helicase RecQ
VPTSKQHLLSAQLGLGDNLDVVQERTIRTNIAYEVYII